MADFLMFAGRLPIQGLRKVTMRGDGKAPGSPIPLALFGPSPVR
ncbi:MAG TPA: hypothetical protein VMT79_17610 [Candidatus Binatia bacterium]|nr:hypothetical protein [Candidatus Binatia bacterium]